MERVGLLCLLLCGSIHMISSETLRVNQTEGNIATLHCGNVTTGSVTWSRDTNGQREDILTTTNGKTTKLISDPDRRYGAGANLALTIFKVSQSDAGRYYCSGAAVELTVTAKPKTLYVRETEGNTATLPCGRQTTGTVTWSRDTNGQREDILATTNGGMTKRIPDPDGHYDLGANLTLIIYGVSQSDAGRYYCNLLILELTVTAALWKILVAVGVSSLVAVVMMLFVYKRFHKYKAQSAVTEHQDHVYCSIKDRTPKPQPVSDLTETNKTIYYLATYPGVQPTETVSGHITAENKTQSRTPKEQVEPLYINT